MTNIIIHKDINILYLTTNKDITEGEETWDMGIAHFAKNCFDKFTIDDSKVTDEVKANPQKYCYTEADGFYLNPDYVEPDPTNIYGIPDELFNQIKSDYREQITSEVSK